MSSTPLFDAPAADLHREIEAELRKPWSRYDAGDVTASRHRGAETSEEAYTRIAPSRERLREQVLGFVRGMGTHGATVEECARELEMRYTTCSARCSELLRDGFLQRSDNRRKTSSGSAARVLVVSR